MNRRGFIGMLGAVAASAVLDPERALWVPGAKTISIPPVVSPAAWHSLAVDIGPTDLTDLDDERFFLPARLMLIKTVEEMAERTMREPRFTPLEFPFGVVFADTHHARYAAALCPMRQLIAYDAVTDRFFGRVDCLVRL